MKNLLLLVLIAFSFTCLAQNNDQKQIDELLDSQKKAWNEGNINEYMDGYWKSDSLRFIGKNGITYGWEATLERYEKSYPDKSAMGKLNFDILSKEPLGKEHYLITGKWTITESTSDASGYFSLVMKKINKKWCIIYDHSS
ncbi:MAG: nuclear transport factor 2 family protein [Bacteroidota bacterium]|nr:nuclear transport factor 2 family protein [Bacteroidota bacterium]